MLKDRNQTIHFETNNAERDCMNICPLLNDLSRPLDETFQQTKPQKCQHFPERKEQFDNNWNIKLLLGIRKKFNYLKVFEVLTA